MRAQLAVALLIAVGLTACVAPPADTRSSGASPANFWYKSDGENAKALVTALETGKPAVWRVDADSHGAVTPLAAAYADRARRACQPLRHERDGVARQLTACKGQDGTWVVAEWSPDRAE